MSILEKQTMDAGHLVWCAIEHCYTHILGFPGRPSCKTAQGLWPQNCCSQQLHSLWCRSFRPTDMSHLRCCHIGSTGWQNLHRYTESILCHTYMAKPGQVHKMNTMSHLYQSFLLLCCFNNYYSTSRSKTHFKKNAYLTGQYTMCTLLG